MIVSIISCAIALIALGYTIYINYSWHKRCNEIVDKLADACHNIAKEEKRND